MSSMIACEVKNIVVQGQTRPVITSVYNPYFLVAVQDALKGSFNQQNYVAHSISNDHVQVLKELSAMCSDSNSDRITLSIDPDHTISIIREDRDANGTPDDKGRKPLSVRSTVKISDSLSQQVFSYLDLHTSQYLQTGVSVLLNTHKGSYDNVITAFRTCRNYAIMRSLSCDIKLLSPADLIFTLLPDFELKHLAMLKLFGIRHMYDSLFAACSYANQNNDSLFHFSQQMRDRDSSLIIVQRKQVRPISISTYTTVVNEGATIIRFDEHGKLVNTRTDLNVDNVTTSAINDNCSTQEDSTW